MSPRTSQVLVCPEDSCPLLLDVTTEGHPGTFTSHTYEDTAGTEGGEVERRPGLRAAEPDGPREGLNMLTEQRE